MTVDPRSEAQAVLDLIQQCLAGDPAASRRFQDEYGELIYGYPQRVYRLPPEEAGDFYVFAFDAGRIYRRLRTFEGRAPLRAYLLGFVLDDLVLEWKRGMREIETVSIEALSELPDTSGPSPALAGSDEHPSDSMPLRELLGSIAPNKAVVMKLLHVEDYELTPDEVRRVAKISGQRIRDVVVGVERLRLIVREREAGLKRVEDALDAVHAWIQLYQRRVQRISDDLASLPPTTSGAERLRDERAQLEQKIERRKQQREKLLAQAQRRKVTAPYKEIAALLGTTVGNVASQIARLRQELALKAEEHGLNIGDDPRDE